MGRDRKLGNVQAGDVAADVSSGGRAGHCVGPLPGATDDDQVRHRRHPDIARYEKINERTAAVWAFCGRSPTDVYCSNLRIPLFAGHRVDLEMIKKNPVVRYVISFQTRGDLCVKKDCTLIRITVMFLL